jgi:hypothetical protein
MTPIANISTNGLIKSPTMSEAPFPTLMTLNERIQFTKWARRRRDHSLHVRHNKNNYPNTTRTSEGFTSFPHCYPTLMKVRETLTNSNFNR